MDNSERHSKQWLRAARWAALAVLLLIGYLAFRTPQPERTAVALVASVCSERSPRERKRQLDEHVAEPLRFELEEQEQVWSPQQFSSLELLARLEEIDLSWPRCQLELEVSRAWSSGDGS